METLVTAATTPPFAPLAVFGIGVPELLLIFGVLILLFGATKLPSLAKGLGQSIKEFKKATQDDETPPAPKSEQKPTATPKDDSNSAA
ncbi:hypothetical protein AXK12_05250 [Cephaloticoccus capnophilus]|uniref:Sec-independent protein translocase protein TatA n=1 Tax=Cephaloticoccus capnophilus TaxID=1548208 RepID=A0A139SLE2_9BACT|nr:twin-arginine translocase TatA/TatE family subunit [Cephaloticoccus capnophilus]KXU35378.1 hypothetical protein AXK12_05250 [Cephaloticoccus capnophilus]